MIESSGHTCTDRAPINRKLRRAYDLRGTYGETLTAADAYGVGLAYAGLAAARRFKCIAVSRDGRLSSPALEAALIHGLTDGGIQVFHLPPGPTPLVSFAIHRMQLHGGIMETGSHNPADQNGFKLLLGGTPIYGDALDGLWAIEPARRTGGSVRDVNLTGEYIEALLFEVEECCVASAAWDSGNGATGAVVEALASRLPGRQQTIFTDVDGTFPNHHPDPSVPENMHDLARVVVEHGLDIGIAFDGDGDRIGVVDSAGEILWADQLMLLLAQDILRENAGATIVADVKSSGLLFSGIDAAGGHPVMSPSGYVLVRQEMLREQAPLAGEMSGHIFFGDRWHNADDALYVAMRTLRALARSGRTLRQFRERLPESFATPELRFACADERKGEVLGAIESQVRATGGIVDSTDGVRVTEHDGWWLVRASGTEPKLTARCEARTREGLRRISAEVAERLAQLDLDAPGLA